MQRLNVLKIGQLTTEIAGPPRTDSDSVRKTIDQVQRKAHWFFWRSDTDQFCRRCGLCNQYAKGKVPRQRLLQDMRVGAPWTEESWISFWAFVSADFVCLGVLWRCSACLQMSYCLIYTSNKLNWIDLSFRQWTEVYLHRDVQLH